jgi:hypothetical protein
MRVAAGDIFVPLCFDHALYRPHQDRRRNADSREAIIGVDLLSGRINFALQLHKSVREVIPKVMAVESCNNLRLGRNGDQTDKEEEKHGENAKHIYSLGAPDLSSLYDDGKKQLTRTSN